jgi:hypothetical protein
MLTVPLFLCALVFWKIYDLASTTEDISFKNAEAQKAHAIGMALLQYAQDHNGKYPEGKSSTDIFQQLVDQKYVADATLFYVPLSGKHAATEVKLKPENVCWDVTKGVLPDDPSSLPILFLTGYKIHYGSDEENAGLGWGPGKILAYCTKEVAVTFVKADKDGVARVSVSPDYDGKSRVYRQLTPDGPLP